MPTGSNAEYDRLYEQASVMLPSPERTAIYRRMNEMVIDDCVAITGLSRTRIYLWHKNVIAIPDREILGGDLPEVRGRAAGRPGGEGHLRWSCFSTRCASCWPGFR